jgi:hypothetical protein
MREFMSDASGFIRRTRRRLLVEVSVLALLAGYFRSDWSSKWPAWLEVTMLVLLVAYILYGLAYYPRAKSIAQAFSIRLMDDGLGFTGQAAMRQIPYRDIVISKVARKNGAVVAIHLRTTFGQSITLEGLEHMDELYEGIAERVGFDG